MRIYHDLINQNICCLFGLRHEINVASSVIQEGECSCGEKCVVEIKHIVGIQREKYNSIHNKLESIN